MNGRLAAGRGLAMTALLCLGGCACENPYGMQKQARHEAYRESDFYADGRAMQWPPEDSVPRSWKSMPAVVRTGMTAQGPVESVPIPVDRALLEQGRRQFETFCATCHGLLGDGDSPVARRMSLRKPPSLIVHQHHATPNAQDAESGAAEGQHPHLLPGHVFAVATHGFGLMPSYGAELSVRDRWAVVAYLDALRLSQRAPIAQLPPSWRERLPQVPP